MVERKDSPGGQFNGIVDTGACHTPGVVKSVRVGRPDRLIRFELGCVDGLLQRALAGSYPLLRRVDLDGDLRFALLRQAYA